MVQSALPAARVYDNTQDREPRNSVDDLIRPCLRKAFPLPVPGQTGDDRFAVMLAALAQLGSGDDRQSRWEPEAE